MKAPYAWLKEYVDITLSPEELAERLTLAGLEVERVDYPWPNIITAQIVWLQPVKGSDHLNATRVWTGREELSVVCGASNIKLHDIVPLAQIGARIGEIVIAEKKAMGVLSQGMLCSPRELGISDDHSGILILPKDTPIGIPLGKALGDDQAVIDLDIKAHRADLLSIVGIAREIAAFTGTPLREPEIVVKERGTAASKLMKLEVRDPEMCPRYSARVVKGIKIGPSPQWMADRLTAAGMRPINNVVDVTNYVMLELGQPLHAFDYDKVADHTIIVRRAEPGETLTTLDDVERKLTPEMTLVTDPAGPNVIAGIFGGARVEVSDETTNLILEAAHWNPTNIRRTSQALALRTEAGSRFEKNPDITLTTVALDRAAQLITQMAGGQVAPGYVDFYAARPTPRVITFDLDQVAWLTNMTVTPTESIAALRALGFGVDELPSEQGALVVRVSVPTWRGDVEESADLVEEVARIVGYDRIPSTIPAGPLPAPQDEPWFWREYEVRDLLLGGGLTEIQTYPLVSRVAMARVLPGLASGEELRLSAPVPSGESDGADASVETKPATTRPQALERRRIEAMAEKLPAITLRNPMSVDMEALRLTLLPGLLAVTRENAKHSGAGLWFFELGRRYLLTSELAAGEGLAEERRTVGVALSGPLAQSWLGERDADFFDLKGVAELLLKGLQITRYRFTQARHPSFHPGRCATLEALALPKSEGAGARATALEPEGAWLSLGVLGEIHPEVAERFDLTRRTYLMELDLERLYAVAPARTLTHPISRYPVAQRDLAVVVARELPEARVAEAIRVYAGPLTPQVQLFDVYTGEGIAPDKKSLAYTLTYRAADRTLTAQEVEAAQQAIIAMLAERFGAALRQ
ncbi:MAG TPA: phenylalanine--tRNA ligase subunit beta [Ktedonobacterales bacterium]|nr:phenylalanine--tRNA ligase subunit beta [Ktedonobacterales bacterium]